MIRWYESPDGDDCGTCGKPIARGEPVGYDHDRDGGEQGHCKPCLTEEN